MAHLVPAAVRGDATQHVTVAAFRDEGPGQSFLRLETRAVEGDQVEVELLPELRAVTFEPAGLGARWDAVEVPGVTGVTLNLTSSGVSQAITASPAWLASSDYRLAPDVTAPAYGGLEPLVQVRRSFYAEVDTDARYRVSIVTLEASALDARASVLERVRERQRARGR